MAEVEYEGSIKKKKTVPVVMLLTGRWERKERVVNCCSPSL